MKRQKTHMDACLLAELAREVLRKGGLFAFYSRGFCMEPDIGDQEKVTLGQVQFDDIAVGDVLLCTTDQLPVLHRVLYKHALGNERYVVLQSDVGAKVHHIDVERVIGKVVSVHRSKRRILKWHLMKTAKQAVRYAVARASG